MTTICYHRGWQVNVAKASRTGGQDFCPDHKLGAPAGETGE